MFTAPTAPASAAPLPPIQLALWSTSHEVRRSRRSEESLDQILIPSHHDSLGYRRIAAAPDAAGLLAAWTLLVGIAARLPRPLRGLLVSEAGRPYSCDDLAVMTGFPTAFFVRAFEFFSDPTIGWLVSPDAALIPAALTAITENRAAAEARQRERAARAQARRQLRAEQKRAQPASPPTKTSLASSARESSDPRPPSSQSGQQPTALGGAPAILPSTAVPPANWRDILTWFCPDADQAHGRPRQTASWEEVYPELKTRVILRAAAYAAAHPSPTQPATARPR